MKNEVVFCIVDDINSYANNKIKITIKNIVDYTISNLYIKGYKSIVGTDVDRILTSIKNFKYAIVMSPGTEFINGTAFFNAVKNLLEKDFFIAGHVLDRTAYDAYYELHHQCYIINLTYYKKLNCPFVGKLEYGVNHTQIKPIRSADNYHDDYTPLYITKGFEYKTYNNRCYGWNLLRVAFENNLNVLIFEESIRNNKKHYYPESEKDYAKNEPYIKYKLDYCKNQFIHTKNTESAIEITELFEQIVIPASGTLYLDLIHNGQVIFYDYNKRALEYWKDHCPNKENIKYIFVHTNLLEEQTIVNYLNPNLKTLINLSNVFCYEGTIAKYSLSQRLSAQNRLVNSIKNRVKDVRINFVVKADEGHQ